MFSFQEGLAQYKSAVMRLHSFLQISQVLKFPKRCSKSLQLKWVQSCALPKFDDLHLFYNNNDSNFDVQQTFLYFHPLCSFDYNIRVWTYFSNPELLFYYVHRELVQGCSQLKSLQCFVELFNLCSQCQCMIRVQPIDHVFLGFFVHIMKSM